MIALAGLFVGLGLWFGLHDLGVHIGNGLLKAAAQRAAQRDTSGD